MTDLQVRRVRFDLDGEIPFCWNPANPVFSLQMNATSIIAIAFEKFIVAAVKEAMPLLRDDATRAEADAFLRQEAQHASSHRQHVRALIRTHPELEEVLDAAVASFDELTATTSLTYRLAYIADLEATFTPVFKLMLDNEATLFRPGDERVASLFLWHFVEEVEHRSSGLILYAHVAGAPWYRLRVVPSVVRHLGSVMRLIVAGFNAHVPLADRRVDAAVLMPKPGKAPQPDPMAGVGRREQLAAGVRLLFSQLPYHDPAHQPLPAFADRWFAAYERGEDIAHWYTRETGRVG